MDAKVARGIQERVDSGEGEASSRPLSVGEGRAVEQPERHWQSVWTSKAPDQVSWFERDPAT